MTALRPQLDKLGLAEYCDTLVSEGFDTWEAVCDVTESDLNELNVKLGHRRKLQRAISEFRIQTKTAPLQINHGKRSSPSDGHASQVDGNHSSREASSAHAPEEGQRQKRKYRRHPKPDENAPERPSSAYVIFSNYMREQLKGQDLSFTDMAKIVGEKWQMLSADAREVYERQAGAAKEKYNTELAEYKKTESYAQYMEYLADFKAKNGPQENGESRRSKLLASESTGSTNSVDSIDSKSRRKSGVSFHGQPGLPADNSNSSHEGYSRHSSHSPAYASGYHSPHVTMKEESAHSQSNGGFMQQNYTPSQAREPSALGRRPSETYYRHPPNGKSPPNGGRYHAQDLPYSHMRSTSAHINNHDSPASSTSSLPLQPPTTSSQLHFEAQPFTSKPTFPSVIADHGSPHNPFQSILNDDGPRSRMLPLPPIRKGSQPANLPPLSPPSNDRPVSSLATLLLAAKEADKTDTLSATSMMSHH